MKFQSTVNFLNLLQDKLGSDLVYSITLDHGRYIVTVATHKSDTRVFHHGRDIQSCEILPSEFSKGKELVTEIASQFRNLLRARDESNAIERTSE